MDGVIAGQIRKREVELYDGSARGQPIADQARRLSRINTNSPRPRRGFRRLRHVRDGGALDDLSNRVRDIRLRLYSPSFGSYRYASASGTRPLVRPVETERKADATSSSGFTSRGPFGPKGY